MNQIEPFVLSLTGNPSALITRPNNTATYTANSCVANSTATATATCITFSDVLKIPAAQFMITGVTLEIRVNAVPTGMGGFRLHLYSASPTPIIDGALYNLPSGDTAKYLGHIDLATPTDLGDNLWSQNDNINFNGKLIDGSTTLYGILETLTSYVATASTIKKIILYVAGV